MAKKYILNGTYWFNKEIMAKKIEISESAFVFTTETGIEYYSKQKVDSVVEVKEIYKKEE